VRAGVARVESWSVCRLDNEGEIGTFAESVLADLKKRGGFQALDEIEVTMIFTDRGGLFHEKWGLVWCSSLAIEFRRI